VYCFTVVGKYADTGNGVVTEKLKLTLLAELSPLNIVVVILGIGTSIIKIMFNICPNSISEPTEDNVFELIMTVQYY